MHLEVTCVDCPLYLLRVACRLQVSQGARVSESKIQEKASVLALSSHTPNALLTLCGWHSGVVPKAKRPALGHRGSPSTLPLWSQIWTCYYLFYFRLTFKIRIHLRSQARAESYPVETVKIQDIFIIKETKVSSHTEYFLTKEILMSPPPRPTSPSSHASPYLPPGTEDRTKLFNITFFG